MGLLHKHSKNKRRVFILQTDRKRRETDLQNINCMVSFGGREVTRGGRFIKMPEHFFAQWRFCSGIVDSAHTSPARHYLIVGGLIGGGLNRCC